MLTIMKYENLQRKWYNLSFANVWVSQKINRWWYWLDSFSFEIRCKAGNHPSHWCRFLVISIFGSDRECERAQQFIKLSRRYFINVPELYVLFKQPNVFVGLFSPFFFALAQLWSHVLFLQWEQTSLPSTMKNDRSCLWLNERCIFTFVRFSDHDWLIGYFERI